MDSKNTYIAMRGLCSFICLFSFCEMSGHFAFSVFNLPQEYRRFMTLMSPKLSNAELTIGEMA